MTEPNPFPWPDPYVPTWAVLPEPAPPVSHLRAAAVGVGALLLGAPAGLVWARLAPPFEVTFSDQGPGVENFDQGVLFGIDATFLLVGVVLGLLCGLAALLVGRGQGPGVPVALAAGCLAAARVAQVVGERVAVDSRLSTFCARATDNGLCSLYDGTPDLRSGGLVVGWAMAALLTFTAGTLLVDRDGVSSG